MIRFEVGKYVMARTDNGWQKGKIVKQWDTQFDDDDLEVPYRIKIIKSGGTVQANVDADRLVRLAKRQDSSMQGEH